MRELIQTSGSTDDDVRAKLTEQMGTIYNIVGICLGIPAATFKWEYYDKSKTYKSIGEVSPLEFYENYVKILYDVDKKVTWNFVYSYL